MRLINADKLKRVYAQSPSAPLPSFVRGSEIDNAPTVEAIPLDKPFCKMVYGDYVCYNRNWLMKHLPMELDILKGKAIPIEWIEKYAKRTSKKCCHCATAIWEMLEDWEKENE